LAAKTVKKEAVRDAETNPLVQANGVHVMAFELMAHVGAVAKSKNSIP